MSILQSIKEDRRLSFNHWRYRLLHWAFNVNSKELDLKNPAEKSGLPRFLYTHYCPLFHLTNLIAILSPILLFIKVICVIVCAAIYALGLVDLSFIPRWCGVAVEYLNSKLPESKEEAVAPVKPVRDAALETRACVEMIAEWEGDFEHFWNCRTNQFTVLKREEVEAIYNEYYPQVEARRARIKARKEWLRNKLIFWTNFSRVFLKWTMNILYVALALIVAYGCFLAFWPVINFFGALIGLIAWFFTDVDYASALQGLWFFLKILFAGAVLAGLVIFLVHFGIAQRFLKKSYQGLSAIPLPTFVFTALGRWITNGWNGVVDFVSMFYEENCPPIILISEEEGIIQKEEGE